MRSALLLESYSDRARLGLAEAQGIASAHGQHEISTRHVLAALASDPRSAAARILDRCEVGLNEMLDVINELDGQGKPSQGHMPFSVDARDLLKRAIDEMRECGHEIVSTAILLQAMVKDPGGEPARILMRLGVLDRVRAEVVDAIRRREQDDEEPGTATVQVVRLAVGARTTAGVVSPTMARDTDAL